MFEPEKIETKLSSHITCTLVRRITHQCEVFGWKARLDEGGVGLLRHQHELGGAAGLLLAERPHQQLRLLQDLFLTQAGRGQLQLHDVQHLVVGCF